jgi:hypothetical protein
MAFDGSRGGKGRAGLAGSMPSFLPRNQPQLSASNVEFVAECRNCRVSAIAGSLILDIIQGTVYP